MKKTSFLFLLISVLLFIPNVTYAESFSEPTTIITNTLSEEDRQEGIEKQISISLKKAKLKDKIVNPTAGDHIYTSEIVATKYKIAEGFVGGQLPGGYNFPDAGGKVYVKSSGGPKISSTITFEVPYKLLSLSLALGEVDNDIGVGVPIPASLTKYYKVHVKQTYRIDQVNHYKQINAHSPKELIAIDYVSYWWSASYQAKEV